MQDVAVFESGFELRHHHEVIRVETWGEPSASGCRAIRSIGRIMAH